MTPEEVVNEFIARIERADLNGACELVTDDVEYDNVPMGKVYGPDGIKSVLDQLSGTIDNVEWVVHRQCTVGNVVMNERTDRFGKDGHWIDLPVAGFFELRDGRISLWRDYFDMGTLMNGIAELSSK